MFGALILALLLSGASAQSVPARTNAARLHHLALQSVPKSGTTPAVNSATAIPPQVRSALAAYTAAIGAFDRQQRRRETGFGLLSQYHGSVNEYLRNNALDAIPHEVRQGGGKASSLRRNQFGFTLTGPLPIGPASRRTAHLSVAFERTNETIDHAFLGTVPTLAERTGNFRDLVDSSGNPVTIYDPATTTPNPAYDPSQPVSSTNLQYLRDPFPNNRIPSARLDPVALNLLRMYPAPNTNVGPFLTNNFFANSPQQNSATGAIVTLDYDLSPRHHLTLRGADSIGLHRQPSIFGNDASPGPTSQSFAERSGSLNDDWTLTDTVVNQFTLSWSDNRQSSVNSNGTNWPQTLGLSGINSNIFPDVQLNGAYVGLGRFFPIRDDDNHNLNLDDHVSIREGSQNLSVGLRYQLGTLNSFESNAPAGNFQFSGLQTSLPGINDTGSPLAQMLLGDVSQMHSSLVPYPMTYSQQRVLVDLQDRFPLWPGFDWTAGLTVKLEGPRHESQNRISTFDTSVVDPATGRLGAMVFGGSPQPPRTMFEPHVGFALNPQPNTVVRGNYFLRYQDYRLQGEGFGSLGYILQPQYTSPNDQLTPAFVLRDGVPQIYAPPPDLSPSVADNQVAQYISPSGILPMNQFWSLQIERQLSSSLVLTTTYNGMLATHQYVGGELDLNALPPSALQYGDQLYNFAFNQSLRPFPQVTGINTGGAYPWGTATREAASIDLQDRFTAGLMFESTYTFSKELDNYGGPPPQNSADLAAQKSLDPYNRSQVLNLNFLYELPIGRDGRWINSFTKLNWLVSDWSIEGFITFQNGPPLIIQPMFNNTGGVADSLRVNRVPGVSARVASPSANLWFNPAAFAQPADFTFGNYARTSPTLRAPGQRLADLSLSRDLPLSETRTLQIFIEGFNAFNHANLNAPDTVIGPPSSPNLHAGKITGSYGGRVIQLGLRFEF